MMSVMRQSKKPHNGADGTAQLNTASFFDESQFELSLPSAESIGRARRLALAAQVIAKRHGQTQTDVALHSTTQLEEEQVNLANQDLEVLQREAESVLSLHDARPLVAAIPILTPLREWGPTEVSSWLSKLPYSAALAQGAANINVDGKLLSAFSMQNFIDLGATDSIEALRLVKAVEATVAVDATIDFSNNLHKANTIFSQNVATNHHVWKRVSTLFWRSNPLSGAPEWTRFTHMILCGLGLHVVTALILLWSYIDKWDPRPLVAGAPLLVGVECFLILTNLKNFKPATPNNGGTQAASAAMLTRTESAPQREITVQLEYGTLIRLCGTVQLSTQDLKFFKCLKKALLTLAITVIIFVGPVLIITDLIVGPSRQSGDVRLSTNSTLWGGHAGSPIGYFCRFGEAIAFMCCLAPSFMPFVYYLCASSLLAYRSAEGVKSKCIADPRLRPKDQEIFIDEIGQEIKDLELSVLQPLSQGLGPPLACLLGLVVVVIATYVPTILDPNQAGQALAVFTIAAISCLGFVLLAIPAFTTSSCNKIVMGVNNLRTTYRGMISHELSRKVNILELYLKSLNKNQGPGFSILGVVVSVGLLQKSAIKIAGLSSVLVPLIHKLYHD